MTAAVATSLVVVMALALHLRFGHEGTVVSVGAAGQAPADTFMYSIATRDGRLGWEQLCSAAQHELPLDLVLREAEALRVADAATGMTVDTQFLRADPRPEGGERRMYVARAWRLGTKFMEKTFVVQTQANGCVEAVE